MAKIWYNRIYAGTHQLSDVPVRWKEDVEAMIDEKFRNNSLSSEDYHRMLNTNKDIQDLDSLIDEYVNS